MSTEITPPTAAEPPEIALDWRKHLNWLAPLTMVVLLATSLWIWSENRATRLRMDVMEAFSTATDAEAYEQVARSWPGEPEAPIALLRAGELRFKKGEFSAALALYEEFLAKHADHPLAEAAAWGRLMSLESAGRLDEALKGYQAITKENVQYPQALFGRARVHEKQGDAEAALLMYDLIEAEFPNGVWANQSREFRKPVEIVLRNRPK